MLKFSLRGCDGIGSQDKEKVNTYIISIMDMNKRLFIPESFNFVLDKDNEQMIAQVQREANPVNPLQVVYTGERDRKVIVAIRDNG